MSNSLNIFDIIWQSGFVVKFVLLILIFASIVSWAIIIKKWKSFKNTLYLNQSFMEVYNNSSNFKEVSEKTKDMEFCPLHNMFMKGHLELSKIKKSCEGENSKVIIKNHFKNYGLELVNRSLKQGIVESNIRLDSWLSVLASVGSVSPFIGLFGTVWGIINSFTGIASGGSTLDAVAPGIAEALVATAVGLAAAIPAVWFYNFFLNRNNEMNSSMDIFVNDFLNVVERSLVSKSE